MSRATDLGDLDVMSEAGYREFTRNAIATLHEMSRELEFVAQQLGTVLAETPHNDSSKRGGSRRDAIKVRNYIRRAAQMQDSAANAVSGAFRVAEENFLPKRNVRQKGMRMNGAKKAS